LQCEEYLESFQKWPNIGEFIKDCSKNESIKKASVFEENQINRFLSEGDNEDAWILVRKAIVVVAICGGHRMDEMRKLQMSNFLEVPNGFEVSYYHSKAREQRKLYK
jgi:hypothetical protein